jgi:hypothetical protein
MVLKLNELGRIYALPSLHYLPVKVHAPGISRIILPADEFALLDFIAHVPRNLGAEVAVVMGILAALYEH